MTINDRQIAKMGSALREFGYPEVTNDYVREQVEAIEKGERPENVVAMLVGSWLEEAGLI